MGYHRLFALNMIQLIIMFVVKYYINCIYFQEEFYIWKS